MFRLLEYFSTLYQLTNLRSDNLFFSYCMGEEEKKTVRYIYFISLAVCHPILAGFCDKKLWLLLVKWTKGEKPIKFLIDI